MPPTSPSAPEDAGRWEGERGGGSHTWGLYPELWFVECWAQGRPLADNGPAAARNGAAVPLGGVLTSHSGRGLGHI